jgi:translation initiation factor 1
VNKKGSGGLVWSSDPDAAEQRARRDGPTRPSRPTPATQEARLSRTRQGRGGKTVILIEGLKLPGEGYDELVRALRQALGTGGTVKGETIEIQGELRDRVADALRARGYRVKLVGG